MKPYIIAADGACSRNPGPGGYGTIVVTPDGEVREFGDGEDYTTNNRMELMGFYRGLQEVYKFWKKSDTQEPQKIKSILDSSYVVDGARKNVWNWSRNGWQTQSGEVKNKDIWEKILKGLLLLKDCKFEFEYVLVKGHSGHEANERVDQISVAYSKKFSGATADEPELFSGKLKDYSINFEVTAPFKTVYLSFSNGELKRHETWPECEAFVKGKQGVKFKKVTNALEERETLKLWGVGQQ